MATSTAHAVLKRIKGFSLVELLVVIGMMAILFTVFIGVLNPILQVNKARDSQREHDFDQIKVGLDAYYNDHGCYPATLPFGYAFTSGSTVYIKKTPQDPSCSATNPGTCYQYETDQTASCPQWNVLYLKLSNPVTNENKVLCPLLQMSNCKPPNMTTLGYNYCSISGNIDCQYIVSNPLPSPAVITTTPTPPILSPTPTMTLTPTPFPTCVPGYANLQYACTGGPPARCTTVMNNGGTYCGFPGCVGSQCCFNQCI